jgi:PAS domain-containing protein
VSHFETEILRKDGMPIPISLSLCPVHGAGGELVSSVVIARDITEQRLAQAALAEVEARVRESEALAHVGSWLWDLRTGTVQWSDQFHRIHGVDPVDFGGTLEAHLDAIHADDRNRVQSAVRQDPRDVTMSKAGFTARVVGAVSLLVGVVLLVRSAPDVARLRRIRRM